MIFRGGLAEKCKKNFSFTGGMSDWGSVKHLERGAFLCAETGKYFLGWYRNMNL